MGWNLLSIPNFNGSTVEVWEWISSFTRHFTGLDKLFGAYTSGFIDKQSSSWWESLAHRPASLSRGRSYNWTCVPRTGLSRYEPAVHFTGPDLFSGNWPIISVWLMASFIKLFSYRFYQTPNNCMVRLNIYLTLLTHLPSAAYTRQWTGSTLVHVMAWRLFGAKPLPEPILAYC